MTASARTLSPETIAAALGQFPPTAEQSRVIAAPLAPALVVAGAGSGKTETMAGRVVWLVANGLVRRDQVLGLTFTRKAAGELAERIHLRLQRLAEFEARGLLPLLPDLHAAGRLDVFARLERAGAGASSRRLALDELGGSTPAAPDGDALLHRPTVATYNAFADQIVRENAVRVGRDAEVAVLSESAAWLLMRRVVLDSDDPRLEEREEALRTVIDAALRIARDATDNLVDLDELAAFPARFATVRGRESTSARVTVYADVAKAATAVGGLAVLVDLAREYAAQKRRLGVIDFSDQVAGAVEIVRGHAAVRDELRDRYRVVLLDEYQDTSVVQTDLLGTAFRDTAVMAVGDPHQSIYGWRGASAGNLGDFAAAFSAAGASARFSLMTSWRNSDDVLTAAGAVLAPLADSSPVPVEPLRPRPGAPRGRVDIAFEADIDAEAERVAAWFADIRVQRTGEATTGAILFRSKKHMVRFADALGRRAIPHRILGLGGLLSTPEVVDVVAALRVISDPRAGSALLRLLAGPRWAIGLADLRALAQLGRRIARHDAALQPLEPEIAERMRASAGDEEGSLIDALDFVLRHPADHGWLAELTPAARERLRDAAGVFAGLRRAAGMPIPELVRLIELELRLDVELAANEARGPARIAGDQLRAFVDELHGFLATDESGSLTSLLAWLDHAERLDEFAPRTEPPEDDVVQLLTIHGSKGLEWDAVAVVRLVEDELPTRSKDRQGWLGFGVLPYSFRGDARWLPRLAWEAHEAPTQQHLRDALEAFGEENRARQIAEERRLAYVAVTRARDRLLLTGSSWSGTKKPREASPFLREIADALGASLPEIEPGENPFEGERRLLQWPLDALGGRRLAVERAAAAVAAAQAAPPAEPSRDLALLLAERASRAAGGTGRAPTRIPASRFKDFATDYAAAVAAATRPLPERPYRQTRLGTLFHAWVEQRSGLTGLGMSIDDALWEAEDDTPGAAHPDADALERLIANFLASEWASLQPIEVETEIDFADEDALGDGQPHVIICKLDAVYRRADGRIEIVDWKTGRPPRTPQERRERMMQLELYRRAYHAKHGVPLEQIDVALYYVADDLVLRG
ncbi:MULTISPECIES: ATP-dependent DNA helicase [Microbacterium]|uniref:DNA 3'-5' helicase n=1 Tax=Microbacterium saccharophilum TaxID=1213358 RepID=A0A7Z7CVU0_9MICO|nr:MULTISPECIES: ATP-dependent DNA helicase [Microbacterium]SFI25483.1 DNA helicase-2 / ATP-dependent DNA helicase PcrA [Microbacterium saccharophilum]